MCGDIHRGANLYVILQIQMLIYVKNLRRQPPANGGP